MFKNILRGLKVAADAVGGFLRIFVPHRTIAGDVSDAIDQVEPGLEQVAGELDKQQPKPQK